jgi:hypothetical protein
MNLDIAVAPRRMILNQNVAAELAIHNAIIEVERIGADVGLTQAVLLLSEAKARVSDFVDGIPYEHPNIRATSGNVNVVTPMTRRHEVFNIIEKEREYQNTRWDDGEHSDEGKSVAEWVLYLDHLVAKAKASVYELNEKEAMTAVRNIAAVAVACMEHNVVPKR